MVDGVLSSLAWLMLGLNIHALSKGRGSSKANVQRPKDGQRGNVILCLVDVGIDYSCSLKRS